MTDKQTNHDPIAHAARLLREAAEELKAAHTIGYLADWKDTEPEVKAAYDEHMAAAQALEDWEAAVGAGGVQALSAAPAGWKLVPVDPSVDQEWKDKEASLRADFMAEACKIYKAMLAASPTPPAGQHTDDIAVDCFARALKAKLAAARAKGRGGWDTPECTQQRLSEMLRQHVGKGDPRDVANFCMFLWARGEAISPPAEQQAMESVLVDGAASQPPISNTLWRMLTGGYEHTYILQLPNDSRDRRELIDRACHNWRRICAEIGNSAVASAVSPQTAQAPQQEASQDTMYLLRRLLSNQHTLTGPEFRAELEKIVGEAYQQEAQEPCGWAADQVRIEKTEKNGWCAYLDIQDADGNRTGTINLCRGIDTENAARALAQNWMREFVPEPKQVAAPQPAPLSEREAFERDWEKRHAPVTINGRTRDDGRYGDSSIQDAWESWQARAALAAQGGQ